MSSAAQARTAGRARAPALRLALIVSPWAFGQYLQAMLRSTGLLGLLLAAGFALGVACTPAPHGMTTEGSDSETTDTACPTGNVGSVGCQCTAGGSCDPGLLCASKICVKPQAETSTTDVTTSTDPTTSDATTEATECNPDGVGDIDPACPTGQPYCDRGKCVDCSGITCADISPSLPLCNPDTGKCVSCLCNDKKPVCDPVAHTCSVCTKHSDCPDSACDLWTGACIPAAAGLWVDGEAGCDDDGAGDKGSPLCTLGAAFTRIAGTNPGPHAVRVQPGTYTLDEALHAPTGHVVALVHATGGDGAPVVDIVAAAGAAITVDPNGALLVDALRLPDGGGDGLTCKQGKAWIDRLTVDGASGRGVFGDGCDLKLRRAVLVGNKIAGVSLKAGKLRLENSFISVNGNTQTGESGVYLAGGASLDAVYTTWVENYGQAGTPFAVACDEDPANESVAVRNSVAINKGLTTLCDGAMVDDTAWSTDAPEGSNIAVTFDKLGVYLTADPALPGVYRAIAGTELDQLAMWKVGDPTIDFDGDARPSDANAPDFAGADRVAR